MGVGKPEDIVEGVMQGVDMFDCVMPTRNARNGSLFTSGGRLNIKNAAYTDDRGRLMKTATVILAPIIPGPISGIFIWQGKFCLTD